MIVYYKEERRGRRKGGKKRKKKEGRKGRKREERRRGEGKGKAEFANAMGRIAHMTILTSEPVNFVISQHPYPRGERKKKGKGKREEGKEGREK